MELKDLSKAVEEIEALEFIKFFTDEHQEYKNRFYVQKQALKSNDCKFYIISKKFPIFWFTAKEDFYGKEFVELIAQVETFDKKFTDLPFLNIQSFEIGKIKVETDKKFRVNGEKYSVDIWRNHSENGGVTSKMIVSTYYGKSFFQLDFFKELYFLDILTKYNLIPTYGYMRLCYFKSFRFYRGSELGIYDMIKKIEFVTNETSVNRVGRDNRFTTRVEIKHLPTDNQISALIVSYYEKFGFEYELHTLTKEESYFAYSPPEPQRTTTSHLSEHEAARLYVYILNNYNYEIEKLKFYENQLNEIMEKMKGTVKTNQVWASDIEKFKILEENEGGLIISGLTDVKFLSLKKGQVCHINKETLESFLKDEMKMFYIV